MIPLLSPGLPLTALRNSANGCKINCGSAAMFDNLPNSTVMWWMRNTSIATGRAYIHKRSGGTGGIVLQSSDGLGNLQYFNDRNTSNLSYIASGTPLAPINVWKLIAATKDQAAGAGLIVHIYRGDLLTPATECTYSAQTDGSGTFKDESAQVLNLSGDGSFGLIGDQGPVVFVNRTLSLADIRRWQFDPLSLPPGAVGAWFPGQEGTGLVYDRTGNGNHGTITSMIPVPGLPLGFKSRARSLALAGRPSVTAPQFRVLGMVG